MKIKALAAAAILVLSLSGCSTSQSAPQAKEPASASATPTPSTLAETWTQSKTATASLISNDLFHAGVCLSEPSSSDGIYQGGDIAKMYKAGEFRSCSNVADPTASKQKNPCAGDLWISSGKDYTLENGQRPLSYEDGYDVALFYGTGWEVSLSPYLSFELDGKQMLEICQPEIQKIHALIGGALTTYGQY